MNVAYVSASNPMGSMGGATNTARNWIDELLERGHDVDVLCRSPEDASYEEDGVGVTELAELKPRERIESELAAGEYDVVLAQDLWADAALAAAAANDLPTVLSLTTTHADPDVVSELSPTRFVANSRYTQQWISGVWGRDSTLVYPHVDFESYDVPSDSLRSADEVGSTSRPPEGPSDSITMINPIDMKGGRTFRALAERFPERAFLAKGGWYSFRNDDFDWDLDALRLQGSTFHGAPLDVPDRVVAERGPTDVDLDDLENVEFRSEPGILDVYARAEVLVVPSVWQETFGRVVLEAMHNEIPVVASHRGGLPEAGGGAALLVDDVADPDAWVETLRRLDDPDTYETVARRGRERAEAYRDRLPEQTDALVATLADAASEG